MSANKVNLPDGINVYYRKPDKSLGQVKVGGIDHEEAILSVKEHLVDIGEGYSGGVLAVIEGGKDGT